MNNLDSLPRIITHNSDSLKVISTKEPNNASSSVEIVKAIGASWPFLITIFAIIIVIIKWKWIWSKLDKTSKIKVAGQKLEFETERKMSQNDDRREIAPISEKKPHQQEVEVKKQPTFWAILESFNQNEYQKAQQLFEELQVLTSDETERQINVINYTSYKFKFGFADAMKSLIELNKIGLSKEALAHYHFKLGECYFSGNNYSQAMEEFQTSLNIAFSSEKVKKIWESKYLLGAKEEAYKFLISKISEQNDPRAKSELFVTLSHHFEKEDDKIRKALALEKALELIPNHEGWLFDAGYTYSEAGIERLAVHHYLKREATSRDKATLNNLGVAFSRLGLKINSVKYYKRSLEEGETLAASNLAHLYLDVGFVDEAEECLNNAITKSEVHNNVWSTKNQIENKKEEEGNFIKKIKTDNVNQILFLRNFANRLFFEEKTEVKISPLKTEEGVHVDHSNLLNSDYLSWKDSNDVQHRITISRLSQVGLATLSTATDKPYLDRNKYYHPGFYMFQENGINFLFYEQSSYVFFKLQNR